MVKGVESSEKSADARGLRIAIVHTRWNVEIVQALVQACRDTLEQRGARVELYDVPGSYELPYACQKISKMGFDACVAIGVLIKGETMHFEYIADTVSHGLMKVQLEASSSFPVIFGVLTCLTEEQARSRAGLDGKGHNHGLDWAEAAIEMARWK